MKWIVGTIIVLMLLGGVKAGCSINITSHATHYDCKHHDHDYYAECKEVKPNDY